jgi:excisionase family DNA binding protein
MARTNGTGASEDPPTLREQLDRLVSLLETLVDRSDTERLLDREEAADVLGISVRKLDSLEEAGEIQAIRIGRSVRYHPDVLDRFMRRRAGGRGS